MKFTTANVTKIKPPAGKADVTIWDDGMTGFGIRFRNGGTGVYVIQYSVNGRQGKMTLGAVTNVKLDDAKIKAHEYFALIADKVDPAIEAAKRAVRGITLKSKIDEYLAYLKKAGRVANYISDNKRSLGGDFGTPEEVTGYFCGLHKYALREVDRGLIAVELNKIEKEHGTGAMRNCRSHLNAFLTWTLKEGLIDVHTGQGTRKPEVTKGTRVLPPSEIIPAWCALGDDDFGTIGKLLWLTWARRNEIGWLRKSEINRERKFIDLPPERVKNGVRHIIPLSNQAFKILMAKVDQRKDSDFVFGAGDGGFGGWARATNRLRDLLGVGEKMEHFTLHDFRRTSRSLAVRRPVSVLPHIAEAILNHISTEESGKKGVAGTYDVNDPTQYFEEKREALQKWADYLDDITRPPLRMVA